MGSSYLKNHFGYSLTEEQFEDIPHPASELVAHVTIKTIQAGAVLGTAVIGPLYALARASTRNLPGIIQTSTRFGRNGMFIGTVLGPVLTYMKAKDFKTAEFTDRDFRLRHNRKQVCVDQAALVGSTMGAGVAMAMGHPMLYGAALGMTTGVLGMAVFNNAK